MARRNPRGVTLGSARPRHLSQPRYPNRPARSTEMTDRARFSQRSESVAQRRNAATRGARRWLATLLSRPRWFLGGASIRPGNARWTWGCRFRPCCTKGSDQMTTAPPQRDQAAELDGLRPPALLRALAYVAPALGTALLQAVSDSFLAALLSLLLLLVGLSLFSGWLRLIDPVLRAYGDRWSAAIRSAHEDEGQKQGRRTLRP